MNYTFTEDTHGKDTAGFTMWQKYDYLEEYLRSLGSAVVGFSGGVDSTFLLFAVQEALGEHCMAVTASSCSFPKRELDEASAFCSEHGIRHEICRSEELEIEGFRENPENRCYLCKNELFSEIKAIALENHMAFILEGSNMDDNGDYRPGLQAVAEQGVKSPLRYAGLSKSEIRQLSKEKGLPTWKKQSFACLSSRFAYGETITEEKLHMVDQAEDLLLRMGFTQVRVRISGKDRSSGLTARIEINPSEFSKLMAFDARNKITSYFKIYGFTYVSLDLQGYRTGSMNESPEMKNKSGEVSYNE